MKKICLLLSGVTNVLLFGCQPEPIHTELAGYTIEFPVTIAELQRQYLHGYKFMDHKFIDSTQSIRAEWQFNVWGSSGNHDPKNEPYGVVIYLKNKGNQLDSVKTALETQYKQSLKPLIIDKLEGNFTKINPPIYVCHIGKETILVLTKAINYRGDPWSEYNSLRISLGYNLTKKEEELFALTSGGIHKDED